MEQKQAYQMFSDFWHLYKKYNERNTSDYWLNYCKEAKEIEEKYHTELCKTVLNGITKEFFNKEVKQWKGQ